MKETLNTKQYIHISLFMEGIYINTCSTANYSNVHKRFHAKLKSKASKKTAYNSKWQRYLCWKWNMFKWVYVSCD